MANAEIDLYPILAAAEPCIYLSLAVANKDLYILEPYPWFHSSPKKTFGLVETRVHAALAMPATLAALCTIFQAFSCEPRLPRGEMQAVLCDARSDTRRLPASTSQPPSAGIRSVWKYNTRTCVCSSKNGPYIRTRLVTPQEKNKHTSQPRPQMRSLLPRRAAARAAGEPRPIYSCLHPCPRAHVDIRGRNGPGRRAPKPHTNPIHMCTAATTAVCCRYCCCAATAEVNLVRAVVAIAALLLLRLVEQRAIVLRTKHRRTKNCKSSSKFEKKFGVFLATCSSQGGGTQSRAEHSQLSDV